MSLLRQILAVLGVAVLLAGLAWSQPDAKPKKVALLVGVNQYDKRGFAERPLNYAERDVEHLKTELEKAGFKVTLLTGSAKGSLRATRANIDKALEATLKGLNARDLVLIGLAGHGQQVNVQGKEDAFFCPVDAEKNTPETMVSLTGLMEKLDRKGGTNLVLVDACRDDPARGGVRGIEGNELQGRLPANTAVLFSCAARQQAFETEQAGGGHGVFFHYVLEGLRGQAKDEDGQVTWSRLTEYVTKNVDKQAKVWFPDRAKVKADGRLQTPHELRNLVDVPVLVDLGKGGTDIGKAERKDVPKSDIGKGGGNDSGKAKQEDLSKTVTVDLGGGVTMDFVRIKAGKFRMGSPKSERDDVLKQFEEAVKPDLDCEQPVHEVEITRDFYLGKYAVTPQQYEALMGTNPSVSLAKDLKKVDTSRFPVENVSWEDAVRYCDKLTEKYGNGGRKFRLPTEAEWEYACRGGTQTPFSFGSSCNGTEANCDGRFPFGTSAKGPYLGGTCAVGSYQPNAWGLYDMHGNVLQWCQDWYDKDYYAKSPKRDPQGPNSGKDRVLRGGSWECNAEGCRAASRLWCPPGPIDYWTVPRVCLGGRGFRAAFRLD
jgi:formylglycine-generating enzyme required for sulfatase activity